MDLVTHFPSWLHRTVLLVVAVAIALAGAIVAHAQKISGADVDATGSGTTYIIAFPDTSGNVTDPKFRNELVKSETSVWIFSAVRNKVKIEINGTILTTLGLDAGAFKVYDLPGAAIVDISGMPSSRSFKIEADYPVIIYCYLANAQGLEAWTPMPVDRWGTRYSVAAVPGDILKDLGTIGATDVPDTPREAPAEILVIAAHDQTNVVLTPPPGLSFAGNASQTVMLNEGQVYQVQSNVRLAGSSQQDDLGGTVVTADKPIAVISGNTRAQVVHDETGLKDNVYKNMMIEWLRPSDQYGRHFVYMPTWDSHRPGVSDTAERLQEFVRVYPGAQASTGRYVLSSASEPQPIPFTVKKDTLWELATLPNAPVYVETDKPAQVMMHSSAIIRFNGSTPCFRVPCLSYSAWAPYMVELSPREQWGSFAPYYASPNPGGMQHYINVVTDTSSMLKILTENGSTFLVNRRIAGTDLVWGSAAVAPGADHWLVGKDGAKFWGFVYGIAGGDEVYRPGRTRKKSEDPAIASGGGGNAPNMLNPAQLQQDNALSYGYPLISRNVVVGPGDSLKIDSVRDCFALKLKALMLNDNASGFRSIELDSATLHNARLTPVDPRSLSDLLGRTRAEFDVEPVDSLAPASGMVVLTDRTGKSWRIPFALQPRAPVITSGGVLDLGPIVFNVETTAAVTIANKLQIPTTIGAIALSSGLHGFEIVEPKPTVFPITLLPGDSLTVRLRARPMQRADTLYSDSLLVTYGCGTLGVRLRATSQEPNLTTSDVDFGTVVAATASVTRMMRLCNQGNGWVVFDNPSGGDVLEWNGGAFSVAASDLARLKSARLGAKVCDSIAVTFTPAASGSYAATAQLRANTRSSRDTSIWRATVIDSAASVNGGNAGDGFMLEATASGSDVAIRYALGAPAPMRVAIYDGGGALVETLADRHAEAGTGKLRWDASGRPAGIYFCTITAGSRRRSVPLVIVH